MTYKYSQTHRIKALYHTPIYVPDLGSTCNHFERVGNVTDIEKQGDNFLIHFKNEEYITIHSRHVVAVHWEKLKEYPNDKANLHLPQLPKL